MIRRLVPLVALVAGALVALLLVGEFALRQFGYQPRRIVLNPNFWVTGWAEVDAQLGWKNRGGAFRSVEPGNALMRFEADGRRHDPLRPKGDSVPKILVVGGSFTQGEGVPDDEPYPHVINRALPNFEVLNFGTGGYGTYQSLLRVEAYFRAPHAPTPLVIYGFNGHHMIRNVAPAAWVTMLTTRDGRYQVPPHVRLSGERLSTYPGRAVELWPLEMRSALVALAHLASMRIIRRAPSAEYYEVLRRLLRRMKAVTDENRAALLVFGQAAVPDEAVTLMRQEGVDYLDCQHPDPLNADLRVGGSGHPNGRMHAWWADCVLRGLVVRKLALPATDKPSP